MITTLLLLQHPLELSTLLQEKIITICSCGDIIVNVTVTSCTDQTAIYMIRLSGAMATEAALLLFTNIQNLTEGLDLGIVTLFLQEQTNNSELDQNESIQSETLAIIVALCVAAMLAILLMFAIMR